MTIKRHLPKNQIVLFAILGIVIVALGLWAWNQFTPRPLGDRLEYLGKEDYGNIFGFDSFPYSVYFYGTDMEAETAVEYFSNATVIDPPSTQPSTSFVLKAPNGESFRVNFYSKDAFQKKNTDLPEPNSGYVLSIPSFKYNAAKASL